MRRAICRSVGGGTSWPGFVALLDGAAQRCTRSAVSGFPALSFALRDPGEPVRMLREGALLADPDILAFTAGMNALIASTSADPAGC